MTPPARALEAAWTLRTPPLRPPPTGSGVPLVCIRRAAAPLCPQEATHPPTGSGLGVEARLQGKDSPALLLFSSVHSPPPLALRNNPQYLSQRM